MTAAGQPAGWVRYWFLSHETAWPYRSIGIDAREVPDGGKVAIIATFTGPGEAFSEQLLVDPVQLDQFAAQWIEFREVTRATPPAGQG